MRVTDYLHATDTTIKVMSEELLMNYKYLTLICSGRAVPAKRVTKAILDYCKGYVTEEEIRTQKSLTRSFDVENKRIIL